LSLALRSAWNICTLNRNLGALEVKPDPCQYLSFVYVIQSHIHTTTTDTVFSPTIN